VNGPDRAGTGTQAGNGLFERVRERAHASIENQKDRAAEGLGTVAEAVRGSTQQLRDQRHETIARYIDEAADQIERIVQRLQHKDVREFLRDLQGFARRQPALFIGAAFAVGVISGRFLKSSPPTSDRSYAEPSQGSRERSYTEQSRFGPGAAPGTAM
jgi:hypothetical protein